jgi:mono/diheme cytochrome c family protein
MTKLMNIRALSLLGTAAFALACGSSDKNPSDNGTTEGNVTVAPPPQETCADNPFLAGCPPVQNNTPGSTTPGGATTPPPPPVATAPAPAKGSQADLAKAAAENILLSNCGQCHGPNGNNSGNMNYINDIDQLVAQGKIVPLDSANSLIIKRMRAGEMPPPYSGLQPVTNADIDVVAQYIDNPQFWGNGATVGNCANSGQNFDFDKLYRTILDDLNSADNANDALNFRYISLTNRYNAGICSDTALDLDRQAISKFINMLSINARAQAPQAIDADQLIYRIDLRLYDFDRAVTVNNQNFTDVWEAIIGFNQYAVPFVGDQADQAKLLSGTQVPVMFADSLLDASSTGNVYYGIIGIDINQNIDDFILNVLGVDQQQDLDDRNEIRAGTTKSRISRQDRVVERHDLGAGRAGVLWQSFDFNDAQNESIFADPFNFNEGGREIIFTQPNGLMAFAIADANGVFQEDSDILLDTQQNNFRAITSISCSSCHSTGFIPVVDEVGPTTLANSRALQLNRDEIEELQEIYPSATEFASIVAADSSQFYQGALDRLKLPTKGGDPVSSIFLRFDKDMTIADAAGDLGVTPKILQGDLRLLNPELQVLENNVLDRDDFTQFYVDSLCRESIVLNNQPDVGVCDAAAAAVAALNQ